MRGDENRHSRGLSAWHTRFACVPVIIGMVLTGQSMGWDGGKSAGSLTEHTRWLYRLAHPLRVRTRLLWVWPLRASPGLGQRNAQGDGGGRSGVMKVCFVAFGGN